MNNKIRIISAALLSLPLLFQTVQAQSASNAGKEQQTATSRSAYVQQVASNSKQQAVGNKAKLEKAQKKQKVRLSQTARVDQETQRYSSDAASRPARDTCVLSRASYTYSCN